MFSSQEKVMSADNIEQLTPGLPGDPRKELALKAGFVSLQDRLSQWTQRARSKSPGTNVETSFVEAFKQQHQPTGELTAPQFATLHEFFQSKTSLRKQLEQEDLLRQQRRPKMPIMKLSKEDWNVKCWEERFKPLGAQRREAAAAAAAAAAAGRRNKENTNDQQQQQQRDNTFQKQQQTSEPKRVAVFNGRVEEVAKKLDKVREGAPMDEQLYRLERNKLRDRRREHSWTDQLKSELSEGLHNPRLLRSKLAGASADQQAPIVAKSPLGRPIGRICQDSDDDDD